MTRGVPDARTRAMPAAERPIGGFAAVARILALSRTENRLIS